MSGGWPLGGGGPCSSLCSSCPESVASWCSPRHRSRFTLCGTPLSPIKPGKGRIPRQVPPFRLSRRDAGGPCQSRPLALRQGGWPTPKRWGGVGWGVCPGRAREGRGPAPGAFRGGRREGREEGTLARGPGRCRPALGCGRRRKGCEGLSAHTPARRPQGSRGSPSAGTRPTSPGSARPWAVDRWRRPSELPSCPDARIWVQGASDPVAQRASAPAKGPGAATTARAPGLRGQVTQCLGSWLGWPGPEGPLLVRRHCTGPRNTGPGSETRRALGLERGRRGVRLLASWALGREGSFQALVFRGRGEGVAWERAGGPSLSPGPFPPEDPAPLRSARACSSSAGPLCPGASPHHPGKSDNPLGGPCSRARMPGPRAADGPAAGPPDSQEAGCRRSRSGMVSCGVSVLADRARVAPPRPPAPRAHPASQCAARERGQETGRRRPGPPGPPGQCRPGAHCWRQRKGWPLLFGPVSARRRQSASGAALPGPGCLHLWAPRKGWELDGRRDGRNLGGGEGRGGRPRPGLGVWVGVWVCGWVWVLACVCARARAVLCL